jgi:hypothetical protein
MNSRREMWRSGSSDVNGFFSKSKADMKNKNYRIIIRQEFKYIDKNQTAQNQNSEEKIGRVDQVAEKSRNLEKPINLRITIET